MPTLIPGVNTDDIGNIIRLALAAYADCARRSFPTHQLFWALPNGALG